MEKRLAEVQQNMVTAQDEYNKPFVHSEALAVKLARQSELNSILNLDKREGVLLDDEGEEKAASENQFDSEEAYENEITA